MSSWTIYLNSRRQNHQASDFDFQNSLDTVGTLGTFEAFAMTWKVGVQPKFSSGGSARVFRDDITPMWEHSANQGGGTMLTNVSEADRHSFAAFLTVMEALIDGKLAHSDMLNGIVVAYRPWGYTMSLWLRAGMDEAARAELESHIREITKDDTLKLFFKLHDEHQAAIEKRRVTDRSHDRADFKAERRVGLHDKAPRQRKEQPEFKSQRQVVQPDDLKLESSELNTTKVRGRRVAPPKYTLAELESRWSKQFEIEQERQAWTLREGLWAVGMFAVSAFVVSHLSTSAF